MNEKKLLEAVGEVNDSYVEEAAGYRKSRKAPLWLRWGAVAACLCVAVLGGSLLLRGGEGLTPDPAPVEVPNPVISVATVEEMEEYLDFPVPVLEKETAALSVLVAQGYPVLGQVEYADGSLYRVQYGSEDVSGIYGGETVETRDVDGVQVECRTFEGSSYAVWTDEGFSFSYTGDVSEVETLIGLFRQSAKGWILRNKKLPRRVRQGSFVLFWDMVAQPSSFSTAALGTSPTLLFTTWPSLKTIRVGMLITPYWVASSGLWSMSSLHTFTSPAFSAAISSSTGASIRQGPHQVAQKSSSTGWVLCSTSASKFLESTCTTLIVSISFRRVCRLFVYLTLIAYPKRAAFTVILSRCPLGAGPGAAKGPLLRRCSQDRG